MQKKARSNLLSLPLWTDIAHSEHETTSFGFRFFKQTQQILISPESTFFET